MPRFSTVFRFFRRVLIPTVVISVAACQDEQTTTRPTPRFDSGSQSVDEEFFGDVYVNGSKTASTGYTMNLSPFDPVTDARLLTPRSFSQWVNPSAAHMYGWWDPAGGGACGNLTDYSNGQRGSESHSPGLGQSPSGSELHCIRPGSYNLSLAGKELKVDYLQMAGSDFTINNTTAGVAEHVEATTYNPGQANNWVDHVVHVDLTPGSYQETRTLDVDNAQASPLSSSFSDQTNPAGTEFDYFRFSAARSSTTWNLNGQGRMLSRLYWDFNNNRAIGTNYYDAHSTANVIRHHQFKDHVFESRNAVVALELMRPDEQPDDTLHVATRTVQITRTTPVAPVACAMFEATATTPYTDQLFDASCSTQGAGIQFRWQFDTNGPWTSYSSDPLYSYAGHSSAGSHVVKLEVLNTTTGLTGFQTYLFAVSGSRIVLSGRTYVTDKATNLYTSSHSLYWLERFDHDTQWLPATYEPRNWMNRIWYAGDYSVSLRQESQSGGSLGRGRLDIRVCNPCDDEPLLVDASARTSSDWGLFGGGPWLSWGTDNTLRLYDFLGSHDLANRFTDIAWLNADSGTAAASGAASLLSWRRRALPVFDQDTKVIDFSIAPAASPFAFGFALDPDLGRNAADDAAGYDAERGMAYVWDNAQAVGFLLRKEENGGNALQSVTQYGLARLPPRTTQESGTAMRGTTIRLLPGRSDVQLLLTAAASSGPVTRTLIVIRGSTLSELQMRADAALRQLSRN